MAFKPPSSAPKRTPDPEVVLPEGATGVDYNPAHLEPDPEVARQKMSASTGPAEVAADRQKAIQTMNAVRLLGPAIRAAVQNGGTDEEQAARFVALLQKANVSAQDFCVRMGLNPAEARNRWAMNTLERLFVEAGTPEGIEAGPELIGAAVAAAQARAVEKDKEGWEDVGNRVSVQAALLKGMVPVWRAQAGFNFFRDASRDADLQAAAQLLIDTAGEALLRLASPMTPPAERRTLIQVLIEEAGAILGGIWEEEAARARHAMAQHKTNLAAWRKANPSGLPLDQVWKRYREQVGRLVKLATLVRPQVRARR